jgi:signal transduction histidine kinase
LSNAVKHSPPEGRVTLAVAEAAGMVEVTVTDQGQGIAREHHRAIFDRFWQVQSDDRQRAGSGLGLTICRTIIEHHGGAIGVNSEPGRGSTFWFSVPAAAGKPPDGGAAR